MFNLNQAIKNWRISLGEQPGFLDSDLDEFEDHLREEIDVLKKSGLSDEEAFLISSLRLGKPEELNTEFAIAEPGRLHRRHLTWMLSGALALVILVVGTQTLANFTTGVLIRILAPAKSSLLLEGLGWFRGLFRIALFLPGGIWILRNIGTDKMTSRLQRMKGRTVILSSFLMMVFLVLNIFSRSYMFAYSGLERTAVVQISIISSQFQMVVAIVFPAIMLMGLWRLVRA